jgi:HEAT repeat protein
MERQLGDLIDALGSEDGLKRKSARETLTLLGEPAVADLRVLLSSANKRIRWEAAKTLAAIVDPASVGAFVELLADDNSDVRWLAGGGLLDLGPRSVAPVLESLIRQPESLGRQQAAARILRGLSSDNDVLAKIIGPVVDVLGRADPGVVASNAASALNELEKTTGVRYRMDSASPMGDVDGARDEHGHNDE